ncbi:MAG: domain, G-beta repeat, partial [Armatimonadetes bacterium]|nr:domain, G-beta repeat [Armatimonadota bacterium]
MMVRLSGSLLALSLACGTASAAPKPAARAAAPAVTALVVSPSVLQLAGAGSSEKVFVTATLGTGLRKDVTGSATLTARGGVVRVAPGTVQALRDGQAMVEVTYGGRKTQLPVTIAARTRPVSFQYDVLPIMSRAGCNQGSCHGNSEGKGGFKISLKGETPVEDYEVIARHGGGRRISTGNPGGSLLLLKATSGMPHGGGQRFAVKSDEYETVSRWIAEGARLDGPEAPRLVRLETTPREQILAEPAGMVRLTVTGRFSGGTIRNLTRRVVYNPGDPNVTVSDDGLVRFNGPTDLAVLVRYADQMENVRLTYTAASKGFT